MNSTRQFFVLFLLLWISSAAQARFEQVFHYTDWLQMNSVAASSVHNAQMGMACVNAYSICASMPADKIGATIRVHDFNGNRTHVMKYMAVQVNLTFKDNPKIGTIVITDLRLADVPTSAGLVFTMGISDFDIATSMGGWEVFNAFGQSYAANDSEFYLLIADGKISLKI